jgi:hypothetical protein
MASQDLASTYAALILADEQQEISVSIQVQDGGWVWRVEGSRGAARKEGKKGRSAGRGGLLGRSAKGKGRTIAY